MEKLTHEVTLGFSNETGILNIPISQFDINRIISIGFTDYGEDYEIPENTIVCLKAKKPDGTEINTDEFCSVVDNKVNLQIFEQLSAVNGIVQCEIILSDETGIHYTSNHFNIIVNKSVHNDENLVSSDTYKNLIEILLEVSDLKRYVETNETVRIECENKREQNEQSRQSNEIIRQSNETQRINNETNRQSAFTETMNNVDTVISNCENVIDLANKKINDFDDEINQIIDGITDIAEEFANAAENSKNAAKDSEDKAKTSENNAAASETVAANSAYTASTKSLEASASATSAAASADTATQKATDAGVSSANAANSASTAETKANEAYASATSAATSATIAETYAKKSQSYAVGGTGTRPGEDTDNSKYYYEQSRNISQGLGGTLIPMGTVTFANLPALSNAESGWMYNISDQFSTTSDFMEGAGNIIPAGANVYKTADGKWDILAGTPVTTVNGQTGNVVLGKDDIGLGDVPNVTTNDQTPTFTQSIFRVNIESGEKLSVMFGKIKKWFTDLKPVAFSNSYTDLDDKPSIPTLTNNLLATESGTALDAAVGPIIKGPLDAVTHMVICDHPNSKEEVLALINDSTNLFQKSSIIPFTIFTQDKKLGENIPNGNYIGFLEYRNGNVIGFLTNHWNPAGRLCIAASLYGDPYQIAIKFEDFDHLQSQIGQINSDLANKVSNNTTPSLNSLELFASTPYIDFHYNKSNKDYTSRIIESSEGNLNFQCSSVMLNGVKFVTNSALPKTKDINVLFNDSEMWIAAGAGMYFTVFNADLPESARILAVSMGEWSGFKVTDNVQVYIPYNSNSKFGFMSNVNQFTNGCNVTVRVLYM